MADSRHCSAGYELMLVLPYVHYLHAQGALSATIGPHGSMPFYHFSPNHTEVNIKRHFCGGTEANRCSSPKVTLSFIGSTQFRRRLKE